MTTVAHVGPLAGGEGGMARVVADMRAWDLPGITQVPVLTSLGRGVWADVVPWIRGLCFVVRGRRRAGLVVHVHLSQGGAFVREGAIVWLAHRLGVPVVAHLHGSRFEAFAGKRPRLVGGVLSRADAVLCLTAASETLVRQLVAVPPPIHLLHNTSEPTSGPLQPARQVVVFAGVVGRRKGVDVLLSAWEKVRAPGWTLEIHGPPDVRDGAVEVQNGERVTSCGATPHGDLMQTLDRSAAAVLPSRAEAFPMFLAEAMAHGAVPIGTDVGDVARLIGDRRRVVPPDDVDALTGALQRLVDLPQSELQELRQGTRERFVAEFSPARLRRILGELWSSLGGATA